MHTTFIPHAVSFIQSYVHKIMSHTCFVCPLVCRIIARDNVDDVLVYTTIVNWESKLKTVEELPREAFVFTDKIKSTDQFLPNAFRHHIGVPDDMFPDTWMNL
jgi:hypothetical protein